MYSSIYGQLLLLAPSAAHIIMSRVRLRLSVVQIRLIRR